MAKVPIQKGPIVADQRTMKHTTRAQNLAEDNAHNALKRDAMSLKLHVPKQ